MLTQLEPKDLRRVKALAEASLSKLPDGGFPLENLTPTQSSPAVSPKYHTQRD